MYSRIAVATLALTFAAVGVCTAQQSPTPSPRPAGTVVVERFRDINLTEAQAAAIAGIQDEYSPKVEAAIAELKSVIMEERDQARGVLMPEQLRKLETMKEENRALRLEGLASRVAHLRDLDLTDDELSKIAEIRKEYRPKTVKALEQLKGVLTPEQAKLREDGLKAGKCRRDVVASLKLTDDQKAKVEAVGNDVRAIVRAELEQIKEVLNPDQQEKVAAMRADRREHVRDRLAFDIANFKELNLTEQQIGQIKAIRAEYGPRVEAAGNGLRAIVREELAAIVAVLKS